MAYEHVKITKQRAQNVRMKMGAELNLKGATIICSFQLLAARLPELVPKLE